MRSSRLCLLVNLSLELFGFYEIFLKRLVFLYLLSSFAFLWGLLVPFLFLYILLSFHALVTLILLFGKTLSLSKLFLCCFEVYRIGLWLRKSFQLSCFLVLIMSHNVSLWFEERFLFYVTLVLRLISYYLLSSIRSWKVVFNLKKPAVKCLLELWEIHP